MQRKIIEGVTEFDDLVSLFFQNGQRGPESIFQVYGPPMSGKTTLLYKFALNIIESHRNLKENRLPLQVFICTTPGESFWEDKFLNTVSQNGSKSLLQLDYPRVAFIPINHTNDLLNFLTYIRTTHLLKNCRTLIVVDSLAYFWQVLLLTKRTRHEIEWFYFNLLDRLRSLTNTWSLNPSESTVVLLANNCNTYNIRDTYLHEPWMLPSPLGSKTWSNEIDSNIYVELDHHVSSSGTLQKTRDQRLLILKGETVLTCEISLKNPS